MFVAKACCLSHVLVFTLYCVSTAPSFRSSDPGSHTVQERVDIAIPGIPRHLPTTYACLRFYREKGFVQYSILPSSSTRLRRTSSAAHTHAERLLRASFSAAGLNKKKTKKKRTKESKKEGREKLQDNKKCEEVCGKFVSGCGLC